MEFLSIAVDAQGPDLPSRYTTKAGTTFTTVVDAENRLGQALGCKAIPNAVNVIPGNASIGLEFRDTDMEALAAAEVELRRITDAAVANDGMDIEVNRQRVTPPVPITPEMQALVAEAAENCGMTWEPLASGAGHDAQAVAAIAPVAMLFVPSVAGISHSPEEYSTPEDCANGAQVLLELLLLADDRL